MHTMRRLMVLFLTLSCTSFSLSHAQQDKDWDHIVFAQSWPATVCRIWKKHNTSHTCNFPSHKTPWSVHGIWPTKSGTKGPAYCNDTWTFDPKKIAMLEYRLDNAWTNVMNGTPKYDLWSHQWNKHGTCAASIQPFNSQYKYFAKGLHLHKKYSVDRPLKKACIKPSYKEKYSLEQFYKPIKNKFGVEADIICYNDAKSKTQYIWEIRLCFSKSLQLIDCKPSTTVQYIEEGVGYLSNCNSSNEIAYTNGVI